MAEGLDQVARKEAFLFGVSRTPRWLRPRDTMLKPSPFVKNSLKDPSQFSPRTASIRRSLDSLLRQMFSMLSSIS
jgi:hypothetical protein